MLCPERGEGIEISSFLFDRLTCRILWRVSARLVVLDLIGLRLLDVLLDFSD